MSNYILCIVNVICMSTGQLLFKYGMGKCVVESPLDMLKAVFNPIIILAIFIYGITTLLWLYILNHIDIGIAYPIQSLAIPFVCLCAALIFGEPISVQKIIGTIIIVIGVGLCVR